MSGQGSRFMGTLYVGIVVAAGSTALALAARGIALHGNELLVWAWVTILCLIVGLGRISVRLPLTGCRVAFGDALLFLSVLLLGTDMATWAGAAEGIGASARPGLSWRKRLFNTAAVALTVHLASRVFYTLTPGSLWGVWEFFPRDVVLPVLALLAVHYALNSLLVSAAVALHGGGPFAGIWKSTFPWAATACLLGSAVAVFVFHLVQQSGPGLLFAAAPFPVIVFVAYRASLPQDTADDAGRES